MQNKIFGTDGIRGKANMQISASLAFFVGKSLAVDLLDQVDTNELTVIVGKDTRCSGDMLISALTAGILSTGVNVLNVGILPTPALSYLVKKTNSNAGVMITASHNPAEYNGIKIFDKMGLKLDSIREARLEQILADIQSYIPNEKVGKLTVDEDLCKLWADYIMQSLGNPNLSKYKILVDCANGAGFRAIPYVLKTLGAIVECYNVDGYGCNINSNCGSTHIESFVKMVTNSKCDIGFSYDGDADRVIVVTNSGRVVSGDELLYIFAKYMDSRGELANHKLITTIMTNFGVERSLSESNIAMERVAVGDKYVIQKMLDTGCNLGGEESGHIILADYNMSSDALLATVYLLKILESERVSVDDLLKDLSKYNTARLDLKVTERQKALVGGGALDKLVQQYSDELGEAGRIVLRASGTECVVRILVEGVDLPVITQIAERLETAVLAL